MSFRSPLGSVLGLGAGGGSQHWWLQRVTAVALVPLGAWFVIALALLPGGDYGTAHAWLALPLHAVLTSLLVVAATLHSWLGVTVIVEDYVAGKARRFAALLVLQFLHVAVGAAALFAVLKVALGSAA
jgi:succinate dehydrogenase / fumarate reductase membrane anchor subunit